MDDFGCVTVLIATYNGEKYLRKQLDSIVNQDYPNIKIFVRDDGSSDTTLSILQDYENRYSISYYLGENRGCARSFWDLVMTAPNSDYYAFSDQDDVWDTNKISRAIIKMREESNNIPLLYCSNVRVVDEHLNVIEDNSCDGKIIETLRHSLIRSLAPGCTFVFNKIAVEKMRKYSYVNNFLDIHDWAAHRIIAALGKVIKDEKTTMNYRQHSNNLIGAKKNNIGQYVKRYINIKNADGVRFKFASDLKLVFFDEMPEENKEILNIFLNYKSDKKSKKLFYNTFKKEFSFIERIFFRKLINKETI